MKSVEAFLPISFWPWTTKGTSPIELSSFQLKIATFDNVYGTDRILLQFSSRKSWSILKIVMSWSHQSTIPTLQKAEWRQLSKSIRWRHPRLRRIRIFHKTPPKTEAAVFGASRITDQRVWTWNEIIRRKLISNIVHLRNVYSRFRSVAHDGISIKFPNWETKKTPDV